MGTFDAAFSDRPVKDEPKEEIVDEPVIEATDDEPEPEKADEPVKTEPAKEPVKEPEPPVKTVPHQALHAERLKREAAEARLAELLETQKKPITSVLDDEDKAFNERLAAATAPIRQQFFKLSVNAAKRVAGREDYDEVYEFMNAEIQANPDLFQQLDQDDPGESIYKLGKIRKELAEVGGDFTKYREHVTAKTNAEMKQIRDENKALKDQLAALQASAEKKAKLPQSLNAEPSGSPKDDVFSGPKPLKSVFSN